MHVLRSICLLLTFLGLTLIGAGTVDGVMQDETTTTADAPRVVVVVNRHETVNAVIEREDDVVIVVRTLDGELRSYPWSRIVGVIRLVTPREGGQSGVVFLRNGQRRIGTIISDGYDEVVLNIEGIRTTLSRSIVDRVELREPFDIQYDEIKRNLRPGMVAQHMALCEWLVEERRYDLAKAELEELLASEPSVPRARQLLKQVDAQIRLEATRPATSTPRIAPVRPVSDWEPPGEFVTDADVNLIRVYEIDFERPPQVEVTADTIRSLIARYGTHELIPTTREARTALFREDAIEIVKLMFGVSAREMYNEIQVLSEPHTLNEFRRRVHNTWLMKNCATSRCHGGPDGGAFFLHNRNYRDARVRYTNLLILERLEVDPDWPLINYDEPYLSLIIQYGLARDMARLPHPEVPGWQPVFTRNNERLLRSTIQWINGMMQPRVDYPVDYDPPRLDPLGGGDPDRIDR